MDGTGTYTWPGDPDARTYTGTFKDGKIVLDEDAGDVGKVGDTE
ncbi:MAG: hypothetical protein IJV00_03355 [Clostridia bacterium]|nr:hypothetical protein [Clostridia bacterium]